MPETRVQVYPTFITLGSTGQGAGFSQAPLQTSLSPGRDVYWDITRIWAYSIGYENIIADGTNGQLSSDPYNVTRGDYNGLTDFLPLNYTPVAMIYKSAIQLDKLIQPFQYVPRTFQPIDLNSPVRISVNDKVVFFAGENIPAPGDGGQRKGRGIAFGIQVIETLGRDV